MFQQLPYNANKSGDKTGKETKEATPEVVEDDQYINSFSSFHFSHKEVVENALEATVDSSNNQNGEELMCGAEKYHSSRIARKVKCVEVNPEEMENWVQHISLAKRKSR
ncbi:hypothetical protein M3221_16705 [Domibacillus indicus]|uniref:hypothetical protein n=1 Tax=Domibacillus indicus TaxID=1437523 RepID=UPI00203B06A3|nr:hypothetical protein [Domibacillus indicus]MCM3790030.1 hypothetical protein [Domibacillus indicus]